MLPSPLVAPPMAYPIANAWQTLWLIDRGRVAEVEVEVIGTFVPLPRALRALALENPCPTLTVVEQNSSPYVTTERARASALPEFAPTNPATIAAIRAAGKEAS